MLSVIVPATDSPPDLDACLAAIESSMPAGSEVVVVRQPPGCGPAAARNAGASRATGDVLAFVDSDVLVAPGALSALADRLARDPELTALFGAYDDTPAHPGIVSRFRNLLHHHTHVSSPGPADTFWAGLGAVRRQAFEEVGGFDAARFSRPAIEDIELGTRLCDAGHQIELDPSIRGTHLKRWTLRSMVATDAMRRGAPWTVLQLERGASSSLNLEPRRRLGAAAAVGAALATVTGRPRLGAALIGVMVALNGRFYALLTRVGGLRLAAAGVPLETVHHLSAASSVPIGIASYLRGWSRA